MSEHERAVFIMVHDGGTYAEALAYLATIDRLQAEQ
jgi:hypothetical protein